MSKTTLSPIIAGAMNWGIWDKNLNTKEMDNIMHLCLENKITTFDHADIYGDYTTEADFGKALISSKIDRSKIQLVTIWIPHFEINCILVRSILLEANAFPKSASVV